MSKPLAKYPLPKKSRSKNQDFEFESNFIGILGNEIFSWNRFPVRFGQSFEWLERAYKQRDGGLANVKGDPLLRNIEHDPRYRPFLQKMKLPLD